jgi:hypothetical protein
VAGRHCGPAFIWLQATSLVYQAAGGSALRRGGRLERCFRNVHVADQHARLSRYGTLVRVGQDLLGLASANARL